MIMNVVLIIVDIITDFNSSVFRENKVEIEISDVEPSYEDEDEIRTSTWMSKDIEIFSELLFFMKSREGDIVGNLWIEVGKRDLYNSGTIDSEDHNTSNSSVEMKRHVSSPSIHNQKHETNTVFCEYNTDSMYNVCHTQSKNEEPSKNILQWKAQSTEELDFLWILLPSNLDILCICIPCRRYPQGDERANQLVIKELIVCLRSIVRIDSQQYTERSCKSCFCLYESVGEI